MGAADRAADDPWSWACLLVSGKKHQVRKENRPYDRRAADRLVVPIAAARCCGDGGARCAAWLLNEHGPPAPHTRAPEARASILRALGRAWRDSLLTLDDAGQKRAFVESRIEQVAHASEFVDLDAKVDHILVALEREEEREGSSVATHDGGDQKSSASISGSSTTSSTHSRQQPYFLLPTDWALLSDAYGVDFVLHGLPGAESRQCSDCGTVGHIHTGARASDDRPALHVGWQELLPRVEEDVESSLGSGLSPGGFRARGTWEALGSGPILPPALSVAVFSLPRAAGTGTQQDDMEQRSVGDVGCRWVPSESCTRPWSCATPAACNAGADCPFKLRDCQLSMARSSSGGLLQSEGVAPLSSRSALTTRPRGGARFSVHVDVPGGPLHWGPDHPTVAEADGDVENFLSTFRNAVASAATISASRVLVLDVGPPFDLRAPRAPHALRATGAGMAGASELRRGATTSTTVSCPRARESFDWLPDTGGGVLSFLAEDEPQTPGERSASSSPALAAGERRGSERSGATRVLALIREPEPGRSGNEPGALQALDLVAAALEQPRSALQAALRPWTIDGLARLWPEAVGRGPHRRMRHRPSPASARAPLLPLAPAGGAAAEAPLRPPGSLMR